MQQLRRYAFLDGIRGMAAVFVLTRHTAELWHCHFYRSYLAVDLFFILSGFVIAHAYDGRISNGAMSVRRFMLVRLVRLYPIFLLSVILCAISLLASSYLHHADMGGALRWGWMSIAATVFFLPFALPGNPSLYPLNGAYWSLLFELIANMGYALVRRFLSDRVLTLFVIVSGLPVACIAFFHGNLDVGFHWTVGHIAGGLLRSFFGIFFGLLLYRKQNDVRGLFLQASPWIAFLVTGTILAFPELGHMDWLIDSVAVGILFPACVLVGAQNRPTRAEGLLLFLGTASYPVYVLHAPLGAGLVHFWPKVGDLAPYSGVGFAVGLMALSVLLERWYDMPVRKFLNNRLKKMTI